MRNKNNIKILLITIIFLSTSLFLGVEKVSAADACVCKGTITFGMGSVLETWLKYQILLSVGATKYKSMGGDVYWSKQIKEDADKTHFEAICKGSSGKYSSNKECQLSDKTITAADKDTCNKQDFTKLYPNVYSSYFNIFKLSTADPAKAKEIFTKTTIISVSCNWGAEAETKDYKSTAVLDANQLKADALSKLNPANITSIPQLIGRGLYFFFAALGTILLALYIYGGTMIMTSSGNAERKSQGTKIIVWATIGVITSLASYIIVKFIFEELGKM